MILSSSSHHGRAAASAPSPQPRNNYNYIVPRQGIRRRISRASPSIDVVAPVQVLNPAFSELFARNYRNAHEYEDADSPSVRDVLDVMIFPKKRLHLPPGDASLVSTANAQVLKLPTTMDRLSLPLPNAPLVREVDSPPRFTRPKRIQKVNPMPVDAPAAVAPTTGGLDNMFTKSPGTWKCQACTQSNAPSCMKCVVCDADKIAVATSTNGTTTAAPTSG